MCKNQQIEEKYRYLFPYLEKLENSHGILSGNLKKTLAGVVGLLIDGANSQ